MHRLAVLGQILLNFGLGLLTLIVLFLKRIHSSETEPRTLEETEF